MDRTAAMTGWLSARSETELAALLQHRSEVLAGVPPRDLAELARRLDHPESVVTFLRSASVAPVQLCEAVQALGGVVTRTALEELLERDESTDDRAHRRHMDRVVDELVTAGVLLVAQDGDEDVIAAPDAFAEIFPAPLGLGPPLRVLLTDLPVDAMRRIQTRLGLDKQKNRAETVAAMIAHLGSIEFVEKIMSSAPAETRDHLLTMAGRSGPDSADPFDPFEEEDDDDFDGYREFVDDHFVSSVYDPEHYRRQQAAIEWARERGLVFAAHYSYGWRMPAEVGRALRGREYHAPFAATPPVLDVVPVELDRRERDSAAAATQFADLVLALLDHIVRAAVPTLKSGGVGARELTKLAKATVAGEVDTRLALELADAAGLLEFTAHSVTVSADFARWRELDPDDRFVALLTAWWALGITPTQMKDPDGKTLRALARAPYCAGCHAARVIAMETLAGVDGALDARALAAAALWRRPFVHVVDEEFPFASVLGEAALLGVTAQAALTAMGRALVSGDEVALLSQAGGLLPKSADRATFGADLTVYVVGAPSARVSSLLDSAADREGRGGAITWRFSPASVRRALDDGATGTALTEALAAIATSELPQPLRYLVADVARRHGNLRLTSVASCVRSDDEALLAEVAADRKLAKLGLRLLAPTVLASDSALDALIVALRKAGYFPVSEDAMADVISLSRPDARTGPRANPGKPGTLRRLLPTEPAAIDHRALAAALLNRKGVLHLLARTPRIDGDPTPSDPRTLHPNSPLFS